MSCQQAQHANLSDQSELKKKEPLIAQRSEGVGGTLISSSAVPHRDNFIWNVSPEDWFRLYQGEIQFTKSQVKVFFTVAVFVWRGFGENEVEWIGKADISRLEALAVGKACYARLCFYSRLNNRNL